MVQRETRHKACGRLASLNDPQDAAFPMEDLLDYRKTQPLPFNMRTINPPTTAKNSKVTRGPHLNHKKKKGQKLITGVRWSPQTHHRCSYSTGGGSAASPWQLSYCCRGPPGHVLQPAGTAGRRALSMADAARPPQSATAYTSRGAGLGGVLKGRRINSARPLLPAPAHSRLADGAPERLPTFHGDRGGAVLRVLGPFHFKVL